MNVKGDKLTFDILKIEKEQKDLKEKKLDAVEWAMKVQIVAVDRAIAGLEKSIAGLQEKLDKELAQKKELETMTLEEYAVKYADKITYQKSQIE
jgi:hypothetical protein